MIKIYGKIENLTRHIKEKRADKLVNKYIKLHDIDTYMDSFEQLYNAKETIANYARSKNVKIDIYKGDKCLPEMISGNEEKLVKDKVFVQITNLKNKKTSCGLIPADTDKIYQYQVNGYAVYDTSDETQIVKKFIAKDHEDNFLRNFYRKIDTLVNQLKGSKKK